MAKGMKWMGARCPSCGCNGTEDCEVKELQCMSNSGCGIDRTSVSFSGLTGITASQEPTIGGPSDAFSFLICTTGATSQVAIRFGTEHASGVDSFSVPISLHRLSFIDSSTSATKVYRTGSLLPPVYSCSGSDTLYLNGNTSSDSCTITWSGADYNPCCGCLISGFEGNWEDGHPTWSNVTGEVHNYLGTKFGTLDNTSATEFVCGWTWDYLYDADSTLESTKGKGIGAASIYKTWATHSNVGSGTDCYRYTEYHPNTNPFGRTWYICMNGESFEPADCPCEGQGTATATCFDHSDRSTSTCTMFCRDGLGEFELTFFIIDEGLSTEETTVGSFSEMSTVSYPTVAKIYGVATTSSAGSNYRYIWFGSGGSGNSFKYGWFYTDVLIDIGDAASCTLIGLPSESVCSETVGSGNLTRLTVSGTKCGDKIA
jgi:hypothetical protein